MKFISLLLSIFFSFLVTVPCNDGIAAYSKNDSTSVEINKEDSNHSDFDSCSIFCTCSCCGLVKSMDQNKTEIAAIVPVETNFKISDYQIIILSKIPFGIWQPPKLS